MSRLSRGCNTTLHAGFGKGVSDALVTWAIALTFYAAVAI